MDIYIEKNISNAPAIAVLFNASVLSADYMAQEEKVLPEKIVKLIQNPLVSIFIIKDTNKLLGYCLAYRKSSHEFSHRLYIQAIAVLPEYRSKGLASELLKEVIKDSVSKKTEIISLDVVSGNKNAVNLYERAGMKEYGRIPRGFRKGEEYFDIVTYCYTVE